MSCHLSSVERFLEVDEIVEQVTKNNSYVNDYLPAQNKFYEMLSKGNHSPGQLLADESGI